MADTDTNDTAVAAAPATGGLLAAVRAKYPQYAKVPDDQLTLAIGRKYPVYLQRDEQFAAQFGKLAAAQVKPNPQQAAELASGQAHPEEQSFEQFAGTHPTDTELAVKQMLPRADTPAKQAMLGRFITDRLTPDLPTTGTAGQLWETAWSAPKSTTEYVQTMQGIRQSDFDTTQKLRAMATAHGLDPDKYAPLPSLASRLGEGAFDAVEDLALTFQSPAGAATLGISTLPKSVQRGISFAFAGQMLSQAPDQANQLIEEIRKPAGQRDYGKIARLAVGGTASLGFGGLAALHAGGAFNDFQPTTKGGENASTIRGNQTERTAAGGEPGQGEANRSGNVQPTTPGPQPGQMAPAARGNVQEEEAQPVTGGAGETETALPHALIPVIDVNGRPVAGGASHDEIVNQAVTRNDPQAVDIIEAAANDANHKFLPVNAQGQPAGPMFTRLEAVPVFRQLTGREVSNPELGLQSHDLLPPQTAREPGAVPGVSTAKPEQAPAAAPAKPTKGPHPDLRQAVAQIALEIKRGPLTKERAGQILEPVYGGTMAAGKFDAKDMSDAIEMAVNKILLDERATRGVLSHPADLAIQHVRTLEALLDRLPTATTRSAETDRLQQFSTPPQVAYVANWAAGIKPGDVVLEPSAGVGGLAVFAKAAGAKVLANELSERRAGLLAQTGIADRITRHNAEHLNAFLQPEIVAGRLEQPTAVVMNPPFSNAAATSRSNTLVGAKHVEEALKLLPPGGRLVAIVGQGMADARPMFRGWWNKIKAEYNVRANISLGTEQTARGMVRSDAFAKYGTSFGTQILVIDKTGPTPYGNILGDIVVGSVEKVEDLIPLLERIRNERPAIKPSGGAQPAPAQPGGESKAVRPGTLARPETARPAEPDAPGPRGPARRAARPVESRGESPAGLEPGGVQPGVSNVAPGTQPEPVGRETREPGQRGATSVQDVARGIEGLTPQDRNVGLTVSQAVAGQHELSEHGVFSEYAPRKIQVAGARPHPTPLVEPTAMAAVDPVDPDYAPQLNPEVIRTGKLSDAQLENVVYAGQAHTRILASGERMGYFIGDGTGVGKGRQIGAIIADNWNQGRRKAVWVSKSRGLIRDAQRDLHDIGFDTTQLFDLGKNGGREIAGRTQGVAFVPYSSLRSGNPGLDPESVRTGAPRLFPPGKAGGDDVDPKQSRLHKLYDWLGPDFDGVIVFDEAHQAGNAIDIKGKRGVKLASAQGRTVLDVQQLFPKARVVYASATGATDITNLSYADRLGIWGQNTPFEDKRKFFNEIQSGGLSAMEIVARDLKSMGRYLARTLSYEGVTRRQLVHTLTPEQRGVYDELARGWQYVLRHRDETMAKTGAAQSGKARSAANSAFYGAQQRFYNQLLTALQMPSILRDIKAERAKNNSVVLQIVNTNEATLGREVAEKAGEAAEGDNYLEDLDLSPRDILLQYIDGSYPTTLYQPVEDENGNIKWVEVRGPDGNIVADPQAVARKAQLMDQMALLKAPTNPLEMLLDTFGADNVAEITGRSRRVINKAQPDGTIKRVLESNRGEAQRKVEAQEFQDGKRHILVFSDAGGTGFSYHASRKAKNQERRVHYLVQAGWKADSAIQGFGRTHRSDQASAPEYVLASTDIRGHQRFISTIARRLSELGALTGGERKSAGGEMFGEESNLENQYADDAISMLFRELAAGRVEGYDFNTIANKLGYTKITIDPRTGQQKTVNTLIDESTGALNVTKIPTVQQFLNRILSLEVTEQNNFFDEFTSRMMQRIEAAKSDGSYDPGTQTLKALSIRKVADQVVYEHPDSTAKTRLVEVEHDQAVGLNTWEDLNKGAPIKQFVQNIRSGRLYALKDGPNRTLESGEIVPTWRRIGPGSSDIIPQREIADNYTPVTEQLEDNWKAQLAKQPTQRTLRDTYVVGAFLPIWDRLKIEDPKIWRITTDTKETFLGAYVPPRTVPELRSRLSAGAGAARTPASVFADVLHQGIPLDLANGWRLRRVRVAGEPRIEVTGVDYSQAKLFGDEHGPGVLGFMERIAFKPRFFVPTDEAGGPEAMAKILAKSPPVAGQEETHGITGSSSVRQAPGAAGKPAAGGPPPAGPVITTPVGGLLKDLHVLRTVVAPQTFGEQARFTANLLRQLSAQMGNELDRADRSLRPFRNDFDRSPLPIGWKYDPTIPLPRNLAFIDAYEGGDVSGLPARERLVAAEFAEQNAAMLDRVHALGTGVLQNFYEHYFPHIWADPVKAKALFAKSLAKAPLAGSRAFLKQRTYQLFREGLAAGLLPVHDNPVDLWMLKRREVERYILAQKFIQATKAAGIPKFVYVFSKSPEGYQRVDDPAFTQYGPPWVEIKEAFDAGLRDKVDEVIERLGIAQGRRVKIGGRGARAGESRWGYETHRRGEPGSERIMTKFGGPEFVKFHELGHALDNRYPDLRAALMATPEQTHELAELARLRYAGETDVSTKFKQNVQTPPEQLAVVVQAYLHAPELFKRVAPHVATAWDAFRVKHPELAMLDEIQPTLRLGEAGARYPISGLVKLGQWYYPDGAAYVLNNYLRPGLTRFALYRHFREASNLLNGIQLVGGFHLGFVTLEAPINKLALAARDASLGRLDLAGKAVLSAPFAPLTNLRRGYLLRKEALAPGSVGGKTGEIVEQLEAGGFRFSRDPFWRTHFTRRSVRALAQAWTQLQQPGLQKAYALSETGKALANVPWAAVEQVMRPVMEYFVPWQKAGAAMEMLGHDLAIENPQDEAALREVSRKVSDSIDNRMGQMTYDNTYINKAAKDVMLLSFRAFGWQLGKYREVLGGFSDLGKLGWNIRRGRWMGLSHRSAYLLALPIGVGLAGGMLNYLLTGEPPKDWRDYYMPRTGRKDALGNEVRISLPTYMKDVIAYARHPALAFAHSLNPFLSTLVDLWNNRDFYNVQIRTPDENTLQQMWADTRFLASQSKPFFLTGAQKLAQAGSPLQQQAAAFFGFMPASRQSSQTPAEAAAGDIMQDMMPAGARTPGQVLRGAAVSGLINDLRTGKVNDQGQLVAQLRTARVQDPRTRATILARLTWNPLQYQVSKMSLDNARLVWKLANPRERQQLALIILNKLQHAHKSGEITDEETGPLVRELVPYLKAPAQPAVSRPRSSAFTP